jgi:hypothetical protein
MALKDWKKTVNDEWTPTGGGFNYFLTFFRSTKNPRKQIEIFQDSDWERKRKKQFGVNIGTLPVRTNDPYYFIEGDYQHVRQFKTKRDALEYAKRHMRR